MESYFKFGEAVWLNLWSTSIAAEVHAIHLAKEKVSYDLKVFGSNGETTRLYRVDSNFVGKTRT